MKLLVLCKVSVVSVKSFGWSPTSAWTDTKLQFNYVAPTLSLSLFPTSFFPQADLLEFRTLKNKQIKRAEFGKAYIIYFFQMCPSSECWHIWVFFVYLSFFKHAADAFSISMQSKYIKWEVATLPRLSNIKLKQPGIPKNTHISVLSKCTCLTLMLTFRPTHTASVV